MKTLTHCLRLSVLLVLGFGAVAVADGQQNSPAQKDSPGDQRAVQRTEGPSNDAGLTDREKALLDRIEKLERRLAELESRAGNTSQPIAAKSPDASRPAENAASNATTTTPGAAATLPSSPIKQDPAA